MPIGKKLKALQKKVTKIVLTSNEIKNQLTSIIYMQLNYLMTKFLRSAIDSYL